jgi:hypothetical protein
MHEHLRRSTGPVGQRAPASPLGEGGPVVSLLVKAVGGALFWPWG